MGSMIRMSWLLIFILSFLFNDLSEAKHEKKQLPSAVVVGTVYCDTCFQQDFSKTSHFISGASVAVECRDGSNSKSSFHKEVKTNEHGEFEVRLPFAVSKHVKRIKKCSVKLISSSEPYCAVASSATSSSLHLKSRKQGTHIFSAGFFTFKPLKQPELCNQKPSLANSKEFSSSKTFFPFPNVPIFPPVTQNPTLPNLPPLPSLPTLPPLPTLPTLPLLPPITQNPTMPNPTPIPLPLSPPPLLPLPPLPVPPNIPPLSKLGGKPKATEFSNRNSVHPTSFFPSPPIPLLPSPPPAFGIPLPPNPFQPPPLLPNPFQPPPLLPNPFQPPPPSINLPPILPPIPGLTPSPTPTFPTPFLPPIPGLTPSPPPPTVRFPFPPFLLPPSPNFPGIPPASPSKKTSP